MADNETLRGFEVTEEGVFIPLCLLRRYVANFSGFPTGVATLTFDTSTTVHAEMAEKLLALTRNAKLKWDVIATPNLDDPRNSRRS